MLAEGNGVVNRAVGGRTVRTTLPDWEKSLAAAERFLKLNPGNNPLQIAYGRALNGCRRWRECVEFLKTIKILPSEFGDNAWDIWHEAWKNIGNAEMADTYPENLGKGKPY